ncbi:hypothetical protein HpCOL15_08800 [Helicobacter pylori]
MTASLTILKYANTLSAEVEFYNQKDIAELKNKGSLTGLLKKKLKSKKKNRVWQIGLKRDLRVLANRLAETKTLKQRPKRIF